MTHKPEVLDQIEGIIGPFICDPRQATVEVTLVSMSPEIFDKLCEQKLQEQQVAVGGGVLQRIRELEKVKKAVVLDTMKTTTLSGESFKQLCTATIPILNDLK